MKNKNFFIIFTALTVIAISLFLFLGVITWKAGDDFVIPFQVMDGGVVNYVWSEYMKWDGRFLSAIIYGLLFQNFYFEKFLGPFLVLLFFANCHLLVLLTKPFKKGLNKTILFFEVIVLIWTTWLSGTVIINAETIYWYTGGVQYVIIPCLGFLWLFLMQKIIQENFNFRWKYLTVPVFLLFSFFIGGGNQTLSPSLLFITIVMLALSGKKITNNKLFLCAFLFFLIGSVMMFIAPGNFARATSSTAAYSRQSMQFSPLTIIINYFTVLFDFIKWAVLLLCIVSIGKLSLIIALNSRTNPVASIKDKDADNEIHVPFLQKYKTKILLLSFFIAALINVTPFIIAPGYAVPRSSIFFRFFLIIFLLGAIDHYSDRIITYLRSKNISLQFMAKGIVLLIGITTIFFALLFSTQGYSIKKQFAERYTILSHLTNEQRNTEVKVEPIDGIVPLCYIHLFHGDIKTDKNSIFNIYVARRYKLKSIALSSEYTLIYKLFNNVTLWKNK